MSELNILKTDKINVNVKLAENYFEEHENTFSYLPRRPLPSNYKTLIKSDGYNNIICEEAQYFTEKPSSDLSWEPEIRQTRLKTLADEIEKNAELFSQIEFLIRKKPVDEVKKYDIKLLSQNLKYYSTTVVNQANRILSETIRMNAGVPLAYLGYVAQMYVSANDCIIVATPETAVVSYLFTELCYLSGMDTVHLILTQRVTLHGILCLDSCLDMAGSCLGVVTGKADVDSSVDAFLDTTTKYPWRLSRILVQESVYETFKNALQWKTRPRPDTAGPNVPSYAARCSALYIYDDKHFLVDYVGAETSVGITVEAYRTTKELLSLMTEEFRYLSLWTNDISEANEIAHHECSPEVIWVNDYGVFQGPSISSQAVYKISPLPIEIPAELKQKQALWLKKSFEDRYHSIYFTILNFVTEKNLPKDNVLWEVLRSLRGWDGPNIISVNNDTMCTCIVKPDPNATISCSSKDINLLSSALGRKLTIGCLFRIKNRDDIFTELFQSLINLGAPLILIGSDCKVIGNEPWDILKTKAIWSNHGTIFAN